MRISTDLSSLRVLAVAAVWGTAGHASAVDVTFEGAATLDRWMYPFGDFGGTRPSAATFTTLYSGYSIFDDRDAQYLIGWRTDGTVPSGFEPFQYRVDSLTVRTSVVVNDPAQSFVFDPTPDPLASFFDPGDAATQPPRAADPARVDDPDAGRSVDLFAVGYRNGFGTTSFVENSPFAPGAAAPRTRNAFAMDFGSGGELASGRDVSNNVTDRFEPSPLASAAAFAADGSAIEPGQTVPDGTELRFAVALTGADRQSARSYVQRGLAEGRLSLMVSSLHPATAFGAGPVSYPLYRTRETPLVNGAARLAVSVRVCVSDIGSAGGVLGADGVLDNNDFISFIDAFFQPRMGVADVGTAGGAFGRDGVLDNNDFIAFIDAFFAGCP